MNKDSWREVKALQYIIREPFVWPGGFEKFAICDDGGIICHRCCKENYRQIREDMRDKYNSGWRVIAIDCTVNTESDLFCDHCGHAFYSEV